MNQKRNLAYKIGAIILLALISGCSAPEPEQQFESPGSTFPGGAPVKLVGYDGPCPPSTHRYAFAIYALNTSLNIPGETNMSKILEAMSNHILSQAELVASFDPSQ